MSILLRHRDLLRCPAGVPWHKTGTMCAAHPLCGCYKGQTKPADKEKPESDESARAVGSGHQD